MSDSKTVVSSLRSWQLLQDITVQVPWSQSCKLKCHQPVSQKHLKIHNSILKFPSFTPLSFLSFLHPSFPPSQGGLCFWLLADPSVLSWLHYCCEIAVPMIPQTYFFICYFSPWHLGKTSENLECFWLSFWVSGEGPGLLCFPLGFKFYSAPADGSEADWTCTAQPGKEGPRQGWWWQRKRGFLKSSASNFSGECCSFLMHLPWVRKADYVQGDKDGCQLSLQSVPAASLAQKPGGVRSESPCVSWSPVTFADSCSGPSLQLLKLWYYRKCPSILIKA